MQGLATRIEGPVVVVGDLHGQVEQFESLLETIGAIPDFEQRWLVFIGDYVDRGPDAKGVLDLIISLRREHPRMTAVAGNHDLAMAAALDWVETPAHSNWHHRWVDHYDAESTFESYGARLGDLDDLAARIPTDHQEFLANLPWCVEHPHYLFVHAGLDTNMPLQMQLRILRQKDFSLSHPKWLCSRSLVRSDVPPDCPLTVVSGHDYVPQVEFRGQRVLVDTTGGSGGELSAVLLPEQRVITSGGQLVAQQSSRSWWKIW